MKDKLLIIDGNSLVNRAFYALPLLTNSKGQNTGAIFGFVNIMTKLLQEEKPNYIVIAFDHSRKTFRNEIYSEYKATRSPMPNELASQLDDLKKLLKVMQITYIEKDNIEADDIIGTLCQIKDIDKIVLSGDKDLFQLIDEDTKVIFTKKGVSETENLSKENLFEKFGFSPEMVVDLKALMGDSSDNIPGVFGIGKKTALTLLEKHKSLDGVFAHIEQIKGATRQKLENNKEMAYISKTLATIKTDCILDGFDLNNCKVQFPYSKKIFSIFEDFEFKTLLKRENIFIEEVGVKSEIKVNKFIIKNVDELRNFSKKVEFSKTFSFFMLDNFKFASDEKNEYTITNEISFFASNLDNFTIFENLKQIFEDENILKITFDLKAHLHLFKKYNINLKGKIFDVSIAKYLINAGLKFDNSNRNVCEFFNEYKTLSQEMENLNLTDLYNKIELPLTYVLFSMEEEGFKIDTNELFNLDLKYGEELLVLTNQIHSLTDSNFNINSPKQLAEVLFEKLQLKSYLNKKLSTNIDVLNELSNQHEVIPLVIRYRKLFKLYTSYIESYKTIISKTGNIIHTIFNQTLTSTGRLSSSEPNLQNIPIRDDEGRNLRKLFVSKFENGCLVSADYNQIELRLLASFSGDEVMKDAYKKNEDIHSLTASQIFNVPISFVTKDMRRQAKAVNFGIIYGISDYGLATQISISRKQAKAYIERYFENYKQVKLYMDKNIEMTKKDGMIRTIFNRLRRINEINSSNYQLRSFGERIAMNMPLQGSASDIIKLAMIQVYNKLKEMNLKSKLILQIHDELIIDTANDEVEIIKLLLKETMENVVKLPVELPVDVSNGKTWFDCK